jgi:hypothetical protein
MAETRRDGTPTTDAQPARGYSWPPFKEGNELSIRHGAFSQRRVSARALEICDALLVAYPYLADDVFAEALERYTREEARAVLLHEYVMSVAEEQGVEAVKPYLWTEAARAAANAQRFAQDCGLDPTGHARIAHDLGVAKSHRSQSAWKGTEELARRGRAIRLDAEQKRS